MTRIYEGGRYKGRFTCDGRTYSKLGYQIYLAKRATKSTLTIASFIILGGYLFTAGVIISKNTIDPRTVYAKEVIEVPIFEVPPVMERIAKCESNNQHTRNGQVIFNANTNGTVDVGRYQINTVWNKKATELKLDITKDSDNTAMAIWIYQNRGTEDWYSSKSCWQK